MVKATIGARTVLSGPLTPAFRAISGSSLSYLPLRVLEILISERRLPFRGLGLMTRIKLGFFRRDNQIEGGIFEASSFRGYQS